MLKLCVSVFFCNYFFFIVDFESRSPSVFLSPLVMQKDYYFPVVDFIVVIFLLLVVTILNINISSNNVIVLAIIVRSKPTTS